MSKNRDDFIREIRDEKKWIVVPIGLKEISMHRKIGKHHITVKLEENANGDFTINPASYVFNSSNAHFTYAQKEVRWSRNKDTVAAVINALKNSSAADHISNLNDFIVINPNCKKSNKKKLAEDLKHLLTLQTFEHKKTSVA